MTSIDIRCEMKRVIGMKTKKIQNKTFVLVLFPNQFHKHLFIYEEIKDEISMT